MHLIAQRLTWHLSQTDFLVCELRLFLFTSDKMSASSTNILRTPLRSTSTRTRRHDLARGEHPAPRPKVANPHLPSPVHAHHEFGDEAFSSHLGTISNAPKPRKRTHPALDGVNESHPQNPPSHSQRAEEKLKKHLNSVSLHFSTAFEGAYRVCLSGEAVLGGIVVKNVG